LWWRWQTAEMFAPFVSPPLPQGSAWSRWHSLAGRRQPGNVCRVPLCGIRHPGAFAEQSPLRCRVDANEVQHRLQGWTHLDVRHFTTAHPANDDVNVVGAVADRTRSARHDQLDQVGHGRIEGIFGGEQRLLGRRSLRALCQPRRLGDRLDPRRVGRAPRVPGALLPCCSRRNEPTSNGASERERRAQHDVPRGRHAGHDRSVAGPRWHGTPTGMLALNRWAYSARSALVTVPDVGPIPSALPPAPRRAILPRPTMRIAAPHARLHRASPQLGEQPPVQPIDHLRPHIPRQSDDRAVGDAELGRERPDRPALGAQPAAFLALAVVEAHGTMVARSITSGKPRRTPSARWSEGGPIGGRRAG